MSAAGGDELDGVGQGDEHSTGRRASSRAARYGPGRLPPFDDRDEGRLSSSPAVHRFDRIRDRAVREVLEERPGVVVESRGVTGEPRCLRRELSGELQEDASGHRAREHLATDDPDPLDRIDHDGSLGQPRRPLPPVVVGPRVDPDGAPRLPPPDADERAAGLGYPPSGAIWSVEEVEQPTGRMERAQFLAFRGMCARDVLFQFLRRNVVRRAGPPTAAPSGPACVDESGDGDEGPERGEDEGHG
ncbi:hypothetical protein [Plantibacter sp. M259]|uniref:hypothetical protein n=1 Tax=Plantibacter sp. M259 TaxID=2583822 RepID=UPI001F10DE1D|nr:hypothetical protein [Plantibacter sp. M259]